MDKDFLNKVLNSNLNEDKLKIIQNLVNETSINSILGETDNFSMPIPKSQNHSNTINNSVQSQEAIQSMLNSLNTKTDGAAD